MLRVVAAGLLVLSWSPAGAAPRAPLPGIVITGGKLSVDVRELPLSVIVTDIADRTGIELHTEGTQDATRVSDRFTDLPFADGLARLLKAAPGSVIVRSHERGYGGIHALYLIQNKGETTAFPRAAPASMEDLRRAIEALPGQEASPEGRQTSEQTQRPAAQPTGSPAGSVNRAWNLDRLLQEAGGDAAHQPRH